ncbi:Signal peptidase complex catalytic subunit S11A [Castilleja foliolosa]|uniref:Signal peptidase complex catalytic subunit SEC11 n=1 Tax=Castilleja foliolosa TaxID=1961234 RepID=A0ABD3D716_9LAMI
MGWVGEQIDSIKSLNFRQALTQAVSLGMIVTSALIIWKGLMCITGSESPVVVVLSGSMEPGFKRGDILFLHMSNDPIRAGEIVVFNIDGREIPIVHRVIKVHERADTGEVDVLTKGDNNFGDDRLLYAQGQLWLNRHHIMGRAVGILTICRMGDYNHDRKAYHKVFTDRCFGVAGDYLKRIGVLNCDPPLELQETIITIEENTYRPYFTTLTNLYVIL